MQHNPRKLQNFGGALLLRRQAKRGEACGGYHNVNVVAVEKANIAPSLSVARIWIVDQRSGERRTGDCCDPGVLVDPSQPQSTWDKSCESTEDMDDRLLVKYERSRHMTRR
jgi:hypothetical protein